MELTGEERVHLAETARRRVAARGSVAAWVGLGAVVLVSVGAMVVTRSLPDGWGEWALILSPTVLLGLLLVVFLGILRRRRQPLVAGADRRTRLAVDKALRAGASDDPRIDALVEDLRGSSLSGNGMRVFFVVCAAVAAGSAVFGDDTFARVSAAFGALCMVFAIGAMTLQQRRISRYRLRRR
jgi:MFS family permease